MLKILFFFVFFFSLGIHDAYAYIDFGTGSYVFQLLAASAVGFIFFIKNYIERIKYFFMKKKSSDENNIKKSEKQK